MKDGWQGHYFVVVSADDHVEVFHEALFKPEEFVGILKEKQQSEVS